MNAGRIGLWTAIGIAIGAAMGAASGNMGMWVAVGLAIGLDLASRWTRENQSSPLLPVQKSASDCHSRRSPCCGTVATFSRPAFASPIAARNRNCVSHALRSVASASIALLSARASRRAAMLACSFISMIGSSSLDTSRSVRVTSPPSTKRASTGSSAS